MSKTKKAIYNFLSDESGPTAVEYAVMLALIIIVCIASVGLVGGTTDELFDTAGQTMQEVSNTASAAN